MPDKEGRPEAPKQALWNTPKNKEQEYIFLLFLNFGTKQVAANSVELYLAGCLEVAPGWDIQGEGSRNSSVSQPERGSAFRIAELAFLDYQILDPLHFIQSDLVTRPFVELRCPPATRPHYGGDGARPSAVALTS